MNTHSRLTMVLVLGFCVVLAGTSSAQVNRLPDEISDQEFWRMITELSEPSGPCTGDNWISNEASIQTVIPQLKQLTKPGGVYLGVGPEQNFTYMLIRWAPRPSIQYVPWYATDMGIVVTILSPVSELVELHKTNRAPTSWPDTLRATQDPTTLAASAQDPSLRRVQGRVTGITGLQPNELLRVGLIENLRPSGLFLTADVAPDGSFEVRNVSPRTYQLIVLRTCKGCNAARVAATPVNVVVTDKDVVDLRLAFVSQ